MFNSTRPEPTDSVYPGEYAISLNEEAIPAYKFSEGTEIMHPPALISESENQLKIEVAVPGAKREEIQVYVDESVLKIFVAHKEFDIDKPHYEQFPDFKTKFYEIEIAIPANVDAEFSCGEIKTDTLSLYLYKCNGLVRKANSRIIVY